MSLTRSNNHRDIGFMCAPERLNVLLSRARNALIMIGNAETFSTAKKGGELWTKFFDMMRADGHMGQEKMPHCAASLPHHCRIPTTWLPHHCRMPGPHGCRILMGASFPQCRISKYSELDFSPVIVSTELKPTRGPQAPRFL